MSTESAEAVSAEGFAMVFVADLLSGDPERIDKKGFDLHPGDGLVLINGIPPQIVRQIDLSKIDLTDAASLIVDQVTGELAVNLGVKRLHTISGRTPQQRTSGRLAHHGTLVEFAWGRTPDAAFTRAMQGFGKPSSSMPIRRAV